MEMAIVLIILNCLAAQLYKHSMPQRIALYSGVQVPGSRPNTFIVRNEYCYNWFPDNDMERQYRYKYNRSVRIRDEWGTNPRISIAVGVVEWRHLLPILRYKKWADEKVVGRVRRSM